MDLDRLYAYRFREVDQARRAAVWKEIDAYLFQRLGAPQRVLDPAAGRGEFINEVPAAERWAVDFADMRAYLAPGVKFVQQDIMAAQLPSGYFDAALVSNFLEHLPDPETVYRFLVKMRECLRPGGRIALMGPNFRYCMDLYYDCADHVLALTHIGAAEHLYTAGFTVSSIVPRFIPYSFRQRIPTHPLLVRAYLKLPMIWPLLGRQFLLIGEKAAG